MKVDSRCLKWKLLESGSDGPVLLNFTSSFENRIENQANPNLALRGFSFIDDIKRLVPGVVSCADIIVLVAGDALVVSIS
ncbi:hypothetical protein RDI58_010457 [Solanum bulbocastanum]|uniref:peroxidase n=1 Tax=Solanum bulbocastanum TaxID=147425 RepID=A0AAN8TWF7_SOLBU